jgi:hypothetical protein
MFNDPSARDAKLLLSNEHFIRSVLSNRFLGKSSDATFIPSSLLRKDTSRLDQTYNERLHKDYYTISIITTIVTASRSCQRDIPGKLA